MRERPKIDLGLTGYDEMFKPVKELPQMEFYDVLKVLRKISLNMNQIAVKANAIGFVDTAEYWKNVDEVQAAISEIKEAVRN